MGFTQNIYPDGLHTKIYPDGLHANIARWAFITESARSAQENPVEFQDKGWGKENNKKGWGREGKILF